MPEDVLSRLNALKNTTTNTDIQDDGDVLSRLDALKKKEPVGSGELKLEPFEKELPGRSVLSGEANQIFTGLKQAVKQSPDIQPDSPGVPLATRQTTSRSNIDAAPTPTSTLPEIQPLKAPTYLDAFFHGVNTSLAGTFDILDYIQSKVSGLGNAVPGYAAGKMGMETGVIPEPDQNEQPRPFKKIAETLRSLAPAIPMDNTGQPSQLVGEMESVGKKVQLITPEVSSKPQIMSQIMAGIGSIIPDILLAHHLVPKIAASQWLQKYGIANFDQFTLYLMGKEGAMKTMEADGKPIAEQAAALAEGVTQGFKAGTTYFMMGGASQGIGNKIVGKLFKDTDKATERLANATTSTLANAMMFGGYEAANEFVETGTVTKERVAPAIGIGLALGLKGVGSALAGKAWMSFTGVDNEVVRSVIRDPMNAEQMREQADKLANEADQNRTDENIASAAAADTRADIKAVTETINETTADAIEMVQKGDLPTQAKTDLIDKINRVVAESDPRNEQAVGIQKKADEVLKQIETISNNDHIPQAARDAQIRPLQEQVNAYKKEIEQLYEPIQEQPIVEPKLPQNEKSQEEGEGLLNPPTETQPAPGESGELGVATPKPQGSLKDVPIENINESEYTRWVTDNSRDPDEIYSAYKQESQQAPYNNLKPWQQQVVDGSIAVTEESFLRVNDKSNVRGNLAKLFFRKNGKPIDVVAQDHLILNEGETVTPEELADFMVDVANDRSKYARKTTDLQNSLRNKYREATGQSINNHDKIKAEIQAEKLRQEQEDLLNDDNFIDKVPDRLKQDVELLGLTPENFAQEKQSIIDAGFPEYTEAEYEIMRKFVEYEQQRREKELLEEETPGMGDDSSQGAAVGANARRPGNLEQETRDRIAELDRQIDEAKRSRKATLDRINNRNEFDLGVTPSNELDLGDKKDVERAIQEELKKHDAQIADLERQKAEEEKGIPGAIKDDQEQGDIFSDNEIRPGDEPFEKKGPGKQGKPGGVAPVQPQKGGNEPPPPKRPSDWVMDNPMTNESLGSIKFPELVRLVKELTGFTPVVRYFKSAFGKFYAHEGGQGKVALHKELFKTGNEQQLGKTISHEIGHLWDWLQDKTLRRGNILGRLASVRDYFATTLKETPSAPDNIITKDEMESMRQQAETALKEEYNKGIREIIEEVITETPIYETTGLTPDDILAIWRNTTSEGINRDLYEYIASSNSATKRNIMAKALKGIVDEALQGKFGNRKQVGVNRVVEKVKKIISPDPITRETIGNRFKELLIDEINRRRLFDLTTMREELKDLSQWWKPFNDQENAEYTKYRYSGKELYADAISVLLNQPQELAARAPHFNRSFFNHIESKPQIKEAYDKLQELIHDPKALFDERINAMKEGYQQAREKITADMKQERPGWVDNMTRSFVSTLSPLIKKLPDKAQYGTLSPKQTVRDLKERMQFINNRYAEIIYKMNDEVLMPLEKIGLDPDDLGIIIQLNRNLAPTRIEKASPGGMQKDFSVEMLQQLKQKYTPEQWEVIMETKKKFHDAAFSVIRDAYDVGIYSDKMMKDVFEANRDNYATYQTIEHATNHISPAIRSVKGTLDMIRNPFEATMAKMFAISNLTYRVRAAKSIAENLKDFVPGDISDAKKIVRNKEFLGFKEEPGKWVMTFYENGEYKGVQVDKYFEDVFKAHTPQEMDGLVKIFHMFNQGFKPMVTSWNPGFAFLFNPIKDLRRSATNLTAISSKRTIDPKAWLSARAHLATNFRNSVIQGSRIYKGELSETIKEMMDAGVFDYRSGIFSRYNPDNSASIDIMASKIGMGNMTISPFETKIAKSKLGRELNKIRDFYFKWAAALEVGTKINAYEYLKRRGFTKDAAAFYTRNYTGTPNYKEGGTKSKSVNEYLPFSTVIIQGLRNDFSLATKPKTAGAYWFDQTIGTVIPATVSALAAAGLFGDDVKKMLGNVSSYYLYNYQIVPLGITETGKTGFLSVPMDEVSRLIYAVIFGITKSIASKELPANKELQQIGQIGMGFLPGFSPMLNVASAWNTYLLDGKNPQDSYRGGDVIKQKNFNAGGWRAMKDMLTWSLSKAGGSGIMSFFEYDPTINTTQEYTVKNIPIISRIYRESSSGMSDKLRKIAEAESEKRGKRIVAQDDVISGVVRKYFDDHEYEKPDGAINLKEYDKLMLKKYFPQSDKQPLTKDEKDEFKRMQQKLRLEIIGGVKGDHQQLVRAIIDSPNNEAVISMLEEYSKILSDAEFMAVLKYMYANGVRKQALLQYKAKHHPAP